MPSDDKKVRFIREQCQVEKDKGYFSEYFGPNLLDGMYSMPIYAVPKPHSEDLRLVTDHSAGPYPLNSMIDHTQVTGFPLDNMRHLGEMLFDIRRSHNTDPLTLWKSDIADTYRLLPMNLHWQLKQIVTVDGQRHVDHNLAFGTSSSPGIFISFNSLVAWIKKNVKKVPFVLNYVDDSSGCNINGNTTLYPPYGKTIPTDQYHLLTLWALTIIGIEVDPNRMTLTLPQDAENSLTAELRFWTAKSPKGSSSENWGKSDIAIYRS